MLCADVVCSKGKETIIAPSTHNAFPTVLISLHHSTTSQNFHLKRPSFLPLDILRSFRARITPLFLCSVIPQCLFGHQSHRQGAQMVDKI